MGEPRQLDFEYMRWIAAVVSLHVEEHLDAAKLRITHLGGGACSMARYFADLYPTSRNTVVELDAKLAEYVRAWFDIPKAPRVKIRVGEAGAVTATFAPASRDVLIRDVFAGDTTPRRSPPSSSPAPLPSPWHPAACTSSIAVMGRR